MKKIILFALALAVCGVLHNSVLAQEPRYLVTYMKSQTTDDIRSATVVTVVNQSKSTTCNVQVDWFRSDNTNVCTLDMFVSPGLAFHFCSRPLPNSITDCSTSLVCDLTAHQGKAIVSSTMDPENECSRIAVEARVYYTTGRNPDDTAISGISNSKVVFADEGNLGD
jgi:hypothetical protein